MRKERNEKKMELMKNSRFIRIVVAALLLTMTSWLLPAELMTVKAEAATQLDNPVVKDTSQMEAGQKVTWDCIWFGSYPQSEVVCETDTDRIGELKNDYYENKYVTVSSAEWKKITGASYSNSGDANVNGVKYKRLEKTDVNYATSGSDNYYNWGDENVHYFRYEPVKWRVLKVDGSDAFLLADKALDDQSYHREYTSVTWETCTVRSWLNGYDSSSNKYGRDYTKENFINTAFSSKERNAIETTDVVNDDNISYGIEGGNDTSDKIFLLSENEVYNSNAAFSYGFTKNSSKYDEGRRCQGTTYARAMGTWSSTDSKYAGNCWWWLRSPGSYTSLAADVLLDGYVSYYGSTVHGYNAVRPALHLNISSSDLWSYAGTVKSDGTVNEVGGGTAPSPDPSPSKPAVTEDQLFGEYASYLDNDAYKNMCGDISMQAYDIIWSRSKLKNTLSALKTCLKSGAAGNIKNIISGYSGLFKDEHELEESVALECAVALSGNKNVFKDASSIINTDYSYTSLAYDMPKNWYQDQELVKKFAQKSAKKSRFTESQVRKAVNDTKKSWSKTDKMFKAAGVSIDLAEAVMLELGTIQAQEEVVDALLANVPEGNALYNGLKRIDKKQQKTWSQNIAEQFLTERMADGLASMGADSLVDFLAGSGTSGSPVVFFAELGFKVAGYAMWGVPDMNEVNRAVILESNTTNIERARSEKHTEILLNYKNKEGKNVKKLKEEYELIYNAKLQLLKMSKDASSAIASDKDKNKLQKAYKKYEKHLTYDKYIKACLADANTDYKYTVKNGKAMITGVNKNSSSAKSLSAKSIAKTKTDGESGNVMNIPAKIDGYDVSGISASAFKDDDSLACISMPESLGEISASAFSGCVNLNTVFLGDSLKDIGGEAFSGCSSLTDIKLPDKIENIDSTAFSGIDNITVTAADKTAGKTFAEESSNAVADVCEPAVTGIELRKAPDAKECRMSEDPDLTGLSVEATFENGTSKDVSDEVYCYIQDKKIGANTVKVVYDDKETSFNIDVVADKCSYKVSYEDEYGDKIADQTTGEAEAGTKVIIISPEIKGYTPVNEKNEFTVGMDSEFTVSYRTVAKKDIKDADISTEPAGTYDGSRKKPAVTVSYKGDKLNEGTDYTVEYGANTDAGKGLVAIYGAGSYTGIRDVEFDISPADIRNCSVKLSASSYTYNGRTRKPAVTVSIGSRKLTGDEFTVTYADGRKNVGRYKVTVKGKGSCTGTKTLYFTINPKSTAISKLTKGKKSFKASWKKVSSQATGYQIQYATSSKFTKGQKSVTIKSYKTTSKNITKLKAKKKYYVRVRSYKKVGKKTYYSGWSKAKTVKTK
ncbi:MAG: fibronectin type III domain-containing protein [Clostridiales bacterium]|nr:fibronectin type III domain-containing protein [Clostridiales bacterium]